MTTHLYGGGFQHFGIEAFLAVVAAQPWKGPTNVQLFLKSNAASFQVYSSETGKRCSDIGGTHLMTPQMNTLTERITHAD